MGGDSSKGGSGTSCKGDHGSDGGDSCNGGDDKSSKGGNGPMDDGSKGRNGKNAKGDDGSMGDLAVFIVNQLLGGPANVS